MAIQPSSGRTVPLFVLIIFVALFVVALTGVVLLFVHQESVRQEAQQAQSNFDSYVGTGVISRLSTFKAMAKPPKTPAGALLDERDQLALLLTGNKASTSKEATDRLNKAIDTIQETSDAAKQLKKLAQADLIGALQQAVLLVKTQMDEVKNVQTQLAACQKDKNTITTEYKQLETTFDNHTKQFLNELAGLKKSFETYSKDYANQLESIKGQVSKELQDKLTKMGQQFNENVGELHDMVRRNLQALIKSSSEMGSAAEVRPVAMTVHSLTQKIDGEVMDRAGNVYYINLGSKDRIRPGVRFCVIPENQKGKAAPTVKAVLEVVQLGELTAEARAIMSLPTDPIAKGDAIINLAYDRDTALSFYVLGDFELLTDTARIQQIIRLSGAQLADKPSPTVNFALIGQPPAQTTADKEEGKESKTVSNFNDMKDQVRAMSIPIVPADLFIKYTGFAQNLD